MDLPLLLIPVKGEVKHVDNFDSSFDACQRRSKVQQLCIPLISLSKVGSNMSIGLTLLKMSIKVEIC